MLIFSPGMQSVGEQPYQEVFQSQGTSSPPPVGTRTFGQTWIGVNWGMRLLPFLIAALLTGHR